MKKKRQRDSQTTVATKEIIREARQREAACTRLEKSLTIKVSFKDMRLKKNKNKYPFVEQTKSVTSKDSLDCLK